jgi:hypothetical protein
MSFSNHSKHYKNPLSNKRISILIPMLLHPIFLLSFSFTMDFNNSIDIKYVNAKKLQHCINASNLKPYYLQI